MTDLEGDLNRSIAAYVVTMLGSFVRLLEIELERLTFARWDATPDGIDRCHHATLTT